MEPNQQLSELRKDAQQRRGAALGAFHGIIGQSPAMLDVYRKIEVYGPADASVLITGETGTGKELAARALHTRSPRKANPFVALNCCALNEELFESELFGHERGAFTGAGQTHRGRFERADGGTLFLDEIGDMSIRVQSKMLRVLEEGVFERVGAETERTADVRVLAATNVSLEQAVRVKRFRSDLYHRIAVFRIHMPPLRERRGDLPLLVNHVVSILNERYGRRVARLTPEALRLLEAYFWPGNVRELRNVLERVYVESRAMVIGRNDFAEWVRERDSVAAGGWDLHLLEQQRMAGPVLIVPNPSDGLRPALPETAESAVRPGVDYPLVPVGAAPGVAIDVPYSVDSPGRRKPGELTAEEIREAFSRAQGNATQAARLLGCHKTTLYRNMKRLGLSREKLSNGSDDDSDGS
jgi:transcriptional regulator with GAF, ATPase, and Fis domain